MTGTRARTRRVADQVPGDSGPPVVGHTLRIRRDPIGWGVHRYQRYGPVSWSRAWGVTVVNLAGADALEVALTNRDAAFANGPGWSPFLEPFFTRGLMLLDGDDHRHHRRIMTEAFTPARLRSYYESAAARVVSTVASWRPGPLTMHPEIKRLSLTIAAETFLGAPLQQDTSRIQQAFTDTLRAGSTFVRVPVPGTVWQKGVRGRRELEQYLAAVIPSARAEDRGDLLSGLCRASTGDGDEFTDRDVVDQMIFLLMAAHDTSTAAMVAMIEYLGAHPQWQERARDEADTVGDLAGPESVDQLEVLDRIMREALRLRSPTPVLARRTVTETEVLGHRIPAGTICSIGLLATHHLPDLWPQPERFDPDRFSKPLAHRYAWRPFGGGAHTCIGMRFAALEIKTVLHSMLRRFRWSVPEGYSAQIDYSSVPLPADGLPVTLQRR